MIFYGGLILNIVLIGYRGSGKTMLGRALAGKLSRKFIDCDRVVESIAGKRIEEIFRDEGEEKFREIEKAAMENLAKLDNYVIALGGGAVLNENGMIELKKKGFVVYLEASAEWLHKMTAGSSKRPRLTDEKNLIDEIRVMLGKRRQLYEKYADFTVGSEGKIPEIADKIASEIANVISKKKQPK